ncbi:TonB-dependent receptor [Haliea sp. E17]|uniref:TonB-dependent receptor n=1 Tax=Haliea sp. E17 TaxID=3401576 RepID=UPI003AAFB2FE
MSGYHALRYLPAAVAAAAMTQPLPSLAQAQLEEVIVTARKREESIMKVPVVATTLSGEQIRNYALEDLNSVSEQVPGLNVGNQVLASGTQVTLRGIGTSTLNPAVDQSVALNVDGMQMTQGFAYRMAMFDIAQLEVLKGPQALFFGKASPAGVIAVTTADPGSEAEISLLGGYEYESEEVLTEMILSGPLTDTLGVRLAARYADGDGYFENTAVPGFDPLAASLGDGSLGARAPDSRDYDSHEYWLVRGTVVWEPTDILSARLKLNYASDESPGSGGVGQMASCPEGTGGLFLDFIGGSEDCKIDDKVNVASLKPEVYPNVKNGGQPYTEADQQFSTLELNYSISDALVITSVTGYYDIDIEAMINGTTTTQFGPAFSAFSHLERDDFTQELRLTSDYDGNLNYLLGAFYQDGTTDFFVDLPFNQIIAQAQRLPLQSLGTAQHRVNTEALSFFGQLLWNILPELELGVGVRWTDEERTHQVNNLSDVVNGGSPRRVDLLEPKIGSDNWAPELTLTYTPSDDITLFGALKQAYKSGSYDVAGIPADGTSTSFDDEEVAGGEGGIKARFSDGRFSFNAAGYYYEFKDLQVERSDFDPNTGTLITHTVNAASADVYGVDVDAAYIPAFLPAMTLYGALSWNKAEYSDFRDAACWGGQTIAAGCDQLYDDKVNGGLGGYTAQDLSGTELLRAPEWSANAGFEYTSDLTASMEYMFGSNVSWSSKFLTNPLARADMYQDSYTKISASLALRDKQGRWDVALIADNLTDELVSGNCVGTDYANGGILGNVVTGQDFLGASGVNELNCNVAPGRAIWLRLTVRPLNF